MRGKQQLTTEFVQFTTVLMKCMNKLVESDSKYSLAYRRISATLSMYADGKSELSVAQSSEYKNIEVFRLELKEPADEYVSQTVTHRYHTMKRKVELSELRLRKVVEIIQQKNPSLLDNLNKVPLHTATTVTNNAPATSKISPPKNKPSPKKKAH
jgi:hypothetical protein